MSPASDVSRLETWTPVQEDSVIRSKAIISLTLHAQICTLSFAVGQLPSPWVAHRPRQKSVYATGLLANFSLRPVVIQPES